ncbi:MAG: sugar ABC transporter ATP-binding protein [Acidobacteriota bacterium]|nr:sugar ABC transporter ATP-binding protein [Acidobacteriota bacterium]MDE3043737.1 sugar ABC transporter ATP-binding protein [Acidobacteriota bacterium]MDE3107445.1 sugar ABC transporter ATP-binding protein [Acidobacteriota bacterium]MDE3222230.1 sugar ABC transporter ATP-binding protein [Acidobacteriota bacterium]
MTSAPETRGSSTPTAVDGPVSSGASSTSALLSLRAVTKSFGPVQALQHVDLDIPAGQVTALIGDNGAGKSTLIKTIAGIYAPTSGDMYWKGEKVSVHSPRDAEALGIATVYQDLALCDNLDIVENMFLGHETTKRGLLDEIQMELKTKQVLGELSVTTIKSTRQLVGSLSGGQRQSIAVARAVMHESQLVIMDEPTAALGVSQTAQVLELIKRLASRNIAVLVISHNLNDVFAVADRVAVMHLGTLVSSGPVADYNTASAVELITTGERATLSHANPA